MVVVELEVDAEFQQQLQQAADKAVFVDFFATWCGPCKAIAPKFVELSNTYSHAVFLKVDVDKLEEASQTLGITAMPTFMVFKNKVKKDEMQGADQSQLEEMVKKWAGAPGAGDSSDQNLPKGQLNLNSFIDESGLECLNESDEHKLKHALDPKGGYLESDVDAQLIVTIAFNQNVKLHSLLLHAQGNKAPKTVRLFANLLHSPDFDGAETMDAIQEFTLTEEDMKADEGIISLKYVKFQNVQSVTLFVKDNQCGDSDELTQIDYLAFVGSPINTTNMNDFKRVAGKAGESH